MVVDTACMCNREDVVNLSSKHQKETPVVDNDEKRGDDKDEHKLLLLLCACGLARAFG